MVAGTAIGISSMRVGEISLLEVPAYLGYGNIFYWVEVLKIESVGDVFIDDDESKNLLSSYYSNRRRRSTRPYLVEPASKSVFEILKLRREMGLLVKGFALEQPICAWSEIKIHEGLANWLKTKGYPTPTPIFSQLVPQLLSSNSQCIFVSGDQYELRISYLIAMAVEKGCFDGGMIVTDCLLTQLCVKQLVDEMMKAGCNLTSGSLQIVTSESCEGVWGPCINDLSLIVIDRVKVEDKDGKFSGLVKRILRKLTNDRQSDTPLWKNWVSRDHPSVVL